MQNELPQSRIQKSLKFKVSIWKYFRATLAKQCMDTEMNSIATCTSVQEDPAMIDRTALSELAMKTSAFVAAHNIIINKK